MALCFRFSRIFPFVWKIPFFYTHELDSLVPLNRRNLASWALVLSSIQGQNLILQTLFVFHFQLHNELQNGVIKIHQLYITPRPDCLTPNETRQFQQDQHQKSIRVTYEGQLIVFSFTQKMMYLYNRKTKFIIFSNNNAPIERFENNLQLLQTHLTFMLVYLYNGLADT